MFNTSLVLPYPPSANNCWRTVKSSGVMYKTKEGKQYALQVKDIVIATREDLMGYEGPVFSAIELFPPDRRKRDVDNVVKPLFDAIEGSGLIVNDNQIKGYSINMNQPHPGGLCVVWMNEYQPVFTIIDSLERAGKGIVL